MCFNSPAVVAAVKNRAGLIGVEIKQELAVLKSLGKEHLFAGVIAGWETYIGRDFETGRPLGYRALSHRGFSERNPPKDPDLERVCIVKEFMELWANSLHAGGVPRKKIFCHIAFTSQGLRAADAKETYAEKVNFALPEVAFSSAYRPGFSTYPEGATFKEVSCRFGPARFSRLDLRRRHQRVSYEHARRTQHGDLSGADVQPRCGDGERILLGHWRRGDAQQFLSPGHGKPRGFGCLCQVSPAWRLDRKCLQRFFQRGIPGKDAPPPNGTPGLGSEVGTHTQVMPLTKKLDAFIKNKKWQEADKVADDLLTLMKAVPRGEATPGTSPVSQRLPPKIQKIEKTLPAWIQKTGNTKEASTLMKKLEEHLNAKDFEEAEKTADAILKMIGEVTQGGAQDNFEESRSSCATSSAAPSWRAKPSPSVLRRRDGAPSVSDSSGGPIDTLARHSEDQGYRVIAVKTRWRRSSSRLCQVTAGPQTTPKRRMPMSYDDRSVVQFLQATHGTDLLSDREKHLVGLAVTITRGCQVCTRNRIVKAHDAGIGDEVLNALFGVVAAINAGVAAATRARDIAWRLRPPHRHAQISARQRRRLQPRLHMMEVLPIHAAYRQVDRSITDR